MLAASAPIRKPMATRRPRGTVARTRRHAGRTKLASTRIGVRIPAFAIMEPVPFRFGGRRVMKRYPPASRRTAVLVALGTLLGTLPATPAFQLPAQQPVAQGAAPQGAPPQPPPPPPTGAPFDPAKVPAGLAP